METRQQQGSTPALPLLLGYGRPKRRALRNWLEITMDSRKQLEIQEGQLSGQS